MGSGCLSPKPRIGEIYIQVIDSIHEESRKVIAEYKIFHLVNLRLAKL